MLLILYRLTLCTDYSTPFLTFTNILLYVQLLYNRWLFGLCWRCNFAILKQHNHKILCLMSKLNVRNNGCVENEIDRENIWVTSSSNVQHGSDNTVQFRLLHCSIRSGLLYDAVNLSIFRWSVCLLYLLTQHVFFYQKCKIGYQKPINHLSFRKPCCYREVKQVIVVFVLHSFYVNLSKQN